MRVVVQTGPVHVAMRLVVFVDEFTLRAPLHGYLQEKMVVNGARGMKWASECFPLEGEYTEPQAKFNGNYLRPRFVRIPPFSEGFRGGRPEDHPVVRTEG